MEEFCTDHPFALDLGWKELQASISLPQNRPLPGNLIHQNERRLALATAHHDPMSFDPRLQHLILLEDPGGIVADLSDVAGLQPPTRAGGNSCGYLAALENFRNAELNLGVEGGEMRETDD